MKEFQPIQRLIEVLHYRRNLREEAHLNGHKPDPELCYPNEVGGHFQIPIDVYTADLKDVVDKTKPL